MTPTDAQIAAFRKVMPSWWRRGGAQKKEETKEIIRCLTAAAEVEKVGEREHSPEWHIIQSTIERCAQVVKQWIDDVGASQHGRDLNTLLAAIRALKDRSDA